MKQMKMPTLPDKIRRLRKRSWPTALVIAIAVAGTLAACTSAVKVDLPAPRVLPSAFEQVPAASGAQTDLAHWWRDWQDPELSRYVDEALQANTELGVAQARVREARSLAAVVDSARYPMLSAQAGAEHGFGNLRDPTDVPDGTPDLDGYAGGVTSVWEVDIFGRRASDSAAASALADMAQEKLRGARIAIAADVAQNYLAARGLQRRLLLLDRSLNTLHDMQRYAEARFRTGQAVRYDVQRVTEQIAAREAERPVLVSEIDVRRRRLAVLAGKAAQQATPLDAPGTFRVPDVPTGELPSTVLERRPDVRATAASVHAQAARLGSAEAQLLPRFYLTFVGLDGHLRLDGLPGLSGSGGLIGVGADLPIFNAGRIRSNIAANDAGLQAALGEYDGSILRALEEVDSSYGARHGLDMRIERLDATRLTAGRNVEDVRQLYEGGQLTMRDVLDARLDALQREDEMIQAQTAQALATVRLYLALGGGWSIAETTVPAGGVNRGLLQ